VPSVLREYRARRGHRCHASLARSRRPTACRAIGSQGARDRPFTRRPCGVHHMPTDGVDFGYAAADRSPVLSLHVLPLLESAALRSGGAGCGQRGLVWRPSGSSRLFVGVPDRTPASILTKCKTAEFQRRSASPAGGAETCCRD
jgi:hypothetical protein